MANILKDLYVVKHISVADYEVSQESLVIHVCLGDSNNFGCGLRASRRILHLSADLINKFLIKKSTQLKSQWKIKATAN